MAEDRENLNVVYEPVETEPEKLETDPALEIEQVILPRQAKGKHLPAWLLPLLFGTGLGMAIAVAAVRLQSNSVPNSKNPPAELAKPQPSGMSVTVAKVERTPITRRLKVTGTVTPRDLISVLPEATGLQVKQILVEEGQTVKKGQVMALLDDTVLRAKINQAQAQLESAMATVSQKQAALAQSQASLAEAQRALERYQQLASAGVISSEALDTRTTTAATARENIRVAQANINSAQADVRSSKANLQQLQTQLAQTRVRAPESGLVAEEIVKVGDIASGTQKLFSIIQNSALELQAKVSAVDLSQVRVGATAQVTTDADSRVRLQARVREIAPLVDAQSRQATVKIALPRTELLRAGTFARAAIATTTIVGIAIPAKAVVSQADGSATVFKLSRDTVEAQPVEIGEVQSNGKVEIKQGLQTGDRVVVAGAGYLKAGDRVKVVGMLNYE